MKNKKYISDKKKVSLNNKKYELQDKMRISIDNKMYGKQKFVSWATKQAEILMIHWYQEV